ncbi:HetZ-related protein [Leptolyngbya sp. PCC 6406]|uniref:HetZ-related protein n=1 Tax=Leptolyngbya sp. PCC 6406 TaxID=1173264 RepID=UPI0002AB9ABC|nr:HetZ-related protein [Leptolyngbya sp. PCC 6406]
MKLRFLPATATNPSPAWEPTTPLSAATGGAGTRGPKDPHLTVAPQGAETNGATEGEVPEPPEPPEALVKWMTAELREGLPPQATSAEAVALRFAREVDRICRMSNRIQATGDVGKWQQSLAHHRLNKCLHYFNLGSRRGRVDLHSTLSAIAYRYIAPRQAQLGFEGRTTLLEDFLQGFYIEVLKAFRRENAVPPDYTPRTRLELAEYMTFSEQYAKRRITIPGAVNQQIIVLRAQTFARRQPAETCVDMDMAMEAPKGDDGDAHGRSAALQQVREQMVTEAVDPADQVLRDRVIQELMTYLEGQEQQDCIDYFVLRLQDLPASEIDEILGLTARQRDYLQQRFKYHVEKFAQVHNWELVHQWLGIDLERNLGLSSQQWEDFLTTLSPLQQNLLQLKRDRLSSGNSTLDPGDLSELLGCTPKRVQRTWGQILSQAWKYRNQLNKT